MIFGKRPFKKIRKALSEKRHYRALWNSFRVYKYPIHNLWLYLNHTGKYPSQIEIKTPIGLVKPTLYSHHDMLTVNEIFCRLDYKIDSKPKVIVDIGSNIGISALYFLTRNNQNRIYLVEPLMMNAKRLIHNLYGLESRYFLRRSCVSNFTGYSRFHNEPTGRYGHILSHHEFSLKENIYPEDSDCVYCIHINQLLEDILSKEDHVDVLKMDIEGCELQIVQSIDKKFLNRVRYIYLESHHGDKPVYLDGFKCCSYGDVYKYSAQQNVD